MASDTSSKADHSRILPDICFLLRTAWSSSFKMTTLVGHEFDLIEYVSSSHGDLSYILAWLELERAASHILCKVGGAEVMTNRMGVSILSHIGNFIAKHKFVMINIHLGHLRNLIEALQLGDV